MLIPKQEIMGFIKQSIAEGNTNWREVHYPKNTILFNDGETIEKLFFIKNGAMRLFKLDRKTNSEYTAGFIFAGSAYVPLSALSNWCPAMAGVQVIENKTTVVEINYRDWLKLQGTEEKQITEMNNYAISLGIYWIEEFVSHYIFEQAQISSFKKYYNEMKTKNSPLFDEQIDTTHLASYFQINKKFLERIKREYVADQKQA